MFREAYYSIYHHPLVMWAVGATVLAALLARGAPKKGFLGVALVVFQLEIMLDAWMTGGLKPIPNEGAIATAASVAFVIIGDLRYFVLLERFGNPKGKTISRWLLLPIGYALIVPLASNVARFIWPGNFRALFLTYELMFATLAIIVRVLVLPKRESTAPHHGFATALTRFEIAQYVLWASADIVILLGADVGYLLRFVPNLMYYTAFVPFVWKVAPAELAP